MPFIARGPGIPHGESSNDVVVNADLTSTILELSGASPGLAQDGQSLMPEPAQPEARARSRDPVRGLRRRADPRRAHLALPLHRVGRRPGPGYGPRRSSTTPTPTPTSSTTSPTTPPTRASSRELGDELDQPDRLRGRRLPRRADRRRSASPTAGSARTAACSPPVTARFTQPRRGPDRRASPSAPARSPSATTPRRRSRLAIPESALRDELPGAGDGDREGAVRRRPPPRPRGEREGCASERASRSPRPLAAAVAAVAGGCGGDDGPEVEPDPRYGEPAELRLHPHRRPEPRAVQPPLHAPDAQADRRPRAPSSPTTTPRRRSAARRARRCSPASTGTTTASSPTSPATGCCESPRTSSRPGCRPSATRPPWSASG